MEDRLRPFPNAPWAETGYATARQWWAKFRYDRGYTTTADFTQPGESNTKLSKSALPTRSLTLYPWTGSGVANVCPCATPQCREHCVLVTAGKGNIPSVAKARILRTEFLYQYPEVAFSLIRGELMRASATGVTTLVRLNVASDLPWEAILPDLFTIPNLRFYDYTKLGMRTGSMNYRLVYSLSEARHSESEALRWLGGGRNVAVVFDTKRGQSLPRTWRGYTVIDGDEHDDRTADPEGVVVGLRAKGSARKLEPGKFVQFGHDT